MRFTLSCLVAFVLLGAPRASLANPEPPALYDARVVGMGGTGAAHVDNSTAVFHNPAQLDQIDGASLSVVVTSLFATFSAPFAGAGTERDSGLNYAPLFFVGAAGELVDSVTLGFGAYVYTGFGGSFDDVDCISYQQAQDGMHPDCDNPDFAGSFDPARDQNVFLFVTEIAFAAQFSLRENLSLGAALRIPWAQQTVTATQEAFGIFNDATQDVSGVGDPSVLVGLTYRPIDSLSLAFAYRSKSAIEMSGTTETAFFDFKTTTTWYTPHMFRFGAAYSFLNDRALLAADFRIQLHSEANRRQVFRNSGILENETIAEFGWKNVYMTSLGAEYYALPSLPLRLGASLGNSASSSHAITQFSPPPGIQYGLYGGLGYRGGLLDLDLAFAYGSGPAHVRDTPSEYCQPEAQRPRDSPGQTITGGGCTGRYKVASWFLSLSATLNID